MADEKKTSNAKADKKADKKSKEKRQEKILLSH